MIELWQVRPCSSAHDVFNCGRRNPVFDRKRPSSTSGILFSDLLDYALCQLRLIVPFSCLLSAPFLHVVMVLLRRSFKDVSRIEARANIASMPSLWSRPATIGKKERQPVSHSVFGVIAAFSITPRRESKRPEQAFIRSVIANGLLKPNPFGGNFLWPYKFSKGFNLIVGWGKLLVGHFRSLIATVLGWVRFSERPSFSIIQVTT